MEYISTEKEKEYILYLMEKAQKAQGAVDYAEVRKEYEAWRKHENWVNSE